MEECGSMAGKMFHDILLNLLLLAISFCLTPATFYQTQGFGGLGLGFPAIDPHSFI